MGTTCERHVVDLVLHFYDAGFMQGILLNKFNKNLVPTFNFTFRYKDYALLLSYSNFRNQFSFFFIDNLKFWTQLTAYAYKFVQITNKYKRSCILRGITYSLIIWSWKYSSSESIICKITDHPMGLFDQQIIKRRVQFWVIT